MTRSATLSLPRERETTPNKGREQLARLRAEQGGEKETGDWINIPPKQSSAPPSGNCGTTLRAFWKFGNYRGAVHTERGLQFATGRVCCSARDIKFSLPILPLILLGDPSVCGRCSDVIYSTSFSLVGTAGVLGRPCFATDDVTVGALRVNCSLTVSAAGAERGKKRDSPCW